MTNDNKNQLAQYVYSQLQSGLNPDEITRQLKDAKWDDVSIKDAFNAVQSNMNPQSQGVDDGQPRDNETGATVVNYAANGPRKRGRIKTSWILFKQSMKVLRNNKGLLRYPFMSGLISVLVFTVFAVIVFLSREVFFTVSTDTLGGEEYVLSPLGYVASFGFYIFSSFIVFMYSAGLAAHVLDIFRGQSQGYKTYMKKAWSKAGPLFVYSVITATVGTILNAIEERARWIGWIVSRILGTLWKLGNLFTIPVIVEGDVGAVTAIKSSIGLFKSRWGENIAGRVTFGVISLLILLLSAIPVFFTMFLVGFIVGSINENAAIIVIILLNFVWLISFAVIMSAASSVLNTALYYYARYETIPAAYDQDILNSVFVQKKKRKFFGKK